MMDKVSFEKLLDPTGKRKKEFDSIIQTLALSPRPKADYSQLEHVQFLGLRFFRRILEIQTAYMLLSGSSLAMRRRGWQAAQIIAQTTEKGELSLILQWSRDAEPQQLYEVYYTYPHRGLITFFADLKLEEPFFDHEFDTRTIDRSFTREMIRLDWGEEDRQMEIEKLLGINKLKSFRPHKQSDEDLKQLTWLKVLELWRKPGKGEPLPELPDFPIAMLEREKEFWRGQMARAWQIGMGGLLNEAVPILEGEKENIPETARRHRRTQWETLRDQADILADAAAESETRRQLHEKETTLAPDVSADLFAVLRIAKKRWGAKAVIALRAHAKGQTEEEAAQSAGITARTLRNYLLKLKKEFSQKK